MNIPEANARVTVNVKIAITKRPEITLSVKNHE